MRRLGLILALLTASPAAAEPSPVRGGWTSLELEVGGRRLAAALPSNPVRDGVLTVVIEGDGAAHDARGAARGDPTPRNPVGRKIAKAWPGEGAAWLGRLCQYVTDPACVPVDWTSGRYSEPAVVASGLAVDELKARTGAARVRLVGWSGGGVLAVLLAARRDDVAGLVTVAAPLDLEAWTRWHGASPLPPTDDPANLPASLPVAQLHLLGAFDTVVPPATARTAARHLAGNDAAVVIANARHTCCWTSLTPTMARIGR